MALRTSLRLIGMCPHLAVPNTSLRHAVKMNITRVAYKQQTFQDFKPLLNKFVLTPKANFMKQVISGEITKQPILEQMFESWCFSMGENVFKDVKNILDGTNDKGYHTLQPFLTIMAWTSSKVGLDFGDYPAPPHETLVPANYSGTSVVKHLWTLGSTLNDRFDISNLASGLFEMAKQHVQATVNQRIEALKGRYEDHTNKWAINLQNWNRYLNNNHGKFIKVCKDVLSPIVQNLQTYACPDSPKQSQNSDFDFETEMEKINEIFDKGVNDMQIQIPAYHVIQESFLNSNVVTENEFLENYKAGLSKYFVSMAMNTASAQLLEVKEN